ncbi:MAG: hypothetical protein EP321_02855 [Sphingomonadales bacterium]|nr:MAG: hypothetical protein EP345_08465 [Sphingomonadales bacterium]TNF05624.1 MAG: hypothetical protein EP321_02855 [Sphingomonadales bacterium]
MPRLHSQSCEQFHGLAVQSLSAKNRLPRSSGKDWKLSQVVNLALRPNSSGLTCTDARGRISQIKEAADCATATGRLVLYSYDDLSRRTSVTRPSGANSSYGYEDTGALDTLGHALAGGSAVNYSFNYNRALQISRGTTDNDLYAWTNHYNVQRSYTANGLDQYSQIMGGRIEESGFGAGWLMIWAFPVCDSEDFGFISAVRRWLRHAGSPVQVALTRLRYRYRLIL